MAETGEAAVGSIHGDKLYQRRARAALPILVRQAWAHQTMFYSDLAGELGMTNPRVLNYPLGAIGNTMLNLAEEMGHDVPPIQALVINKSTALPGEGISWFAPDAARFKSASRRERKFIVDEMLRAIFTYQHWNHVLDALGLDAPTQEPLPPVESVIRRGGGEGAEHKALKHRIAENPQLLSLPASLGPGQVEAPQYSGDSVDVFFADNRTWIAVEVKGKSAPSSEILRGLFQCVKYEAVLEAQSKYEGRRLSCEALLALGGSFPRSLAPLRNTLQVRVVDDLGGSAG